ncbi:Charged multivesicular body protein 1b [Blattella germanica]|nr:Charged multivesicular body protein 1b [Blattella germanica]
MEAARIHAESAIRQRNQSLLFTTVSARLDAVANKVQYAITMKRVTNSMIGVSSAMEGALKAMDMEKITTLMDKFEKQFDEMDVKAGVVDSTLYQTTTTIMPQNQVDDLMSQIAEENGLQINLEMPSVVTIREPSAESSGQASLSSDLSKQLKTLRDRL